MFLPEVATPIYSEITQVRSWGSLSESVTRLCGPSYSEIVTSRVSDVCGAGESAACHASSASPSDASAYSSHSVSRRTCLKGF